MSGVVLTDGLLRTALAPAPTIPAVEMAMVVSDRIRTTRQVRRTALPWVASPAADLAGRRRAATLRLALLSALVAAALVGVAIAGALLLRRPALTGPVVVIRHGTMMTIEDGALSPVAAPALLGYTVQGVTTSSDGRILVVYTEPTARRQGKVLYAVLSPYGDLLRGLMPPEGTVVTGDTYEWSRDGRSVLATVSRSGRHALALLSTGGEGGRILTPPDLVAERGTWSPDGRLVAFRGSRPAESNAADIFVMDVSTGEVRRLTRDLPGIPAQWFPPQWSPDGRTIAFDVNRLDAATPIGIFLVPLDGSDVERLTPVGMAAMLPYWSPMGDWIAFANLHTSPGKCHTDLFAMRADGSDEHLVIPNGSPGGWTPDGAMVGEVIAVPTAIDGAQVGLPGAPHGGVALAWPDSPEIDVLYAYSTADTASPSSQSERWAEYECGWTLSPSWQHQP